MEILLQGIIIGLSLTIMVGPITLTIIDASLAGGWKAGLVSALMMWISDFILIYLIYVGGQEMIESLTSGNVNNWVNFAAGAILLCIGIVLWFLRNKELDLSQSRPSAGSLVGHGFRGFLVNTFSPFTLLFWPTMIAGTVFGADMTRGQAIIYFAGIMGAIITGDLAKVFFANWIRTRISQKYMRTTRMATAVLFAAGGVYMLVRGLVFG